MGATAENWRWSPRIFHLLGSLNLSVEYDSTFVFSGSSPGAQAYEPFLGLVIDPDKTDEDDLLHEIGHHLDCIHNRPEDLLKCNWGMDSKHFEGEDIAESVACDLEIGIRSLWGWPWRERAALLSMPDWWPPGWSWPERGKLFREITIDYLATAGVTGDAVSGKDP